MTRPPDGPNLLPTPRSAGAQRSYRNGPKNNWRLTIWNDCLRRAGVRARLFPVVYLAGSEDLDRLVAERKGVPVQNLIGVDKDLTNALRRKKAGLPTFHGDVLDLLRAWPDDRPVATVLLDFCGGLERKVFSALMVLTSRAPFLDAVVMVNMQRGRDAASNKSRGTVDYFTRALGVPSARHRGEKLVHAYILHLLAGRVVTPDFFHECVALLRPSYYSYRSSSLTFDSVVIDLKHLPIGGKPVPAYGDVSIKRRIAAMLAVRTKRLRTKGGAR